VKAVAAAIVVDDEKTMKIEKKCNEELINEEL